ncbi:MAG: UDP-N-acetylglucosamine 2-epimerase (non-hydrolyzing) [Agriterribacter sp.]
MIVTLIGARPQFVKAAVVSKAFIEQSIPEIIVHSGQHYDERMSNIFWEELGIPKPLYNLNIGSGSHAVQTAGMMVGLEQIINRLQEKPRAVLLYGDTNTTVAGSLVAAKLHIPIIHIEAGLRSFNKTMPEEVNRVVTDHLSDLLFCPSEASVKQLTKEGISQNVYNVGDVMYDSFLTFSALAKKLDPSDVVVNISLPFTLLTLHRPVNTDNKETLSQIFSQLALLPMQIIWPLHPRNRNHIKDLTIPENIQITDPFSYLEMLLMLEKCSAVVTDSGGLQKEAYWAKKPCFTLRSETEWVETLEGGWNRLISIQGDELSEKFGIYPHSNWKPLYGNGKAANEIAAIIKKYYYQA